MAFKNIILASESIHRQTLLKQVGLTFRALPARIDERVIEKSFTGTLHGLSEFLSYEKAKSLKNDFADSIIIGSDQVLIFNNKILHKPTTTNEVFDRLKLLQGKTHELSTGLCILSDDQIFRHQVVAKMTMHPLSDGQINKYIEQDQPLGCAGGYKIEKKGPLLFKSIETQDYFSIIGLPLLSLLSTLRDLDNLRP